MSPVPDLPARGALILDVPAPEPPFAAAAAVAAPAEERLAVLYERFRSVLENSLDAAYRRDLRTDTYDYVSPVMERVLGVTTDWLRAADLDSVLARIHPGDRDAVLAAVDQGRRHGRGHVEYRFLTDGGAYRWVADHFSEQRDEQGRPRYRTGIVRDASRPKAAELALQEALETAEQERRRAEAANDAKSRFLAVMSHELRTPLTGVIGFADLLESQVLGPLTARQEEAVARIKASSWHLVGIIDEILTISRVEAGKEEVHWAEADVAGIAREVAAIIEPQANARALLVQRAGTEEPLLVWSDAGKLRQILLNLLGNAAKFTERGSISVRVDRADPAWVRIQVSDTGPGIPAPDRERVFEPFTQLDNSHTRRGAGTGLGLAICRRLAWLLGGQVALESEPGQGSTFTLTVPRRPPPA